MFVTKEATAHVRVSAPVFLLALVIVPVMVHLNWELIALAIVALLLRIVCVSQRNVIPQRLVNVIVTVKKSLLVIAPEIATMPAIVMEKLVQMSAYQTGLAQIAPANVYVLYIYND